MSTRRLAPLAAFSCLAYAQTAVAPGPEVASSGDSFTIKSKVTLVLVPVVVRDKSGKVVGNLRQEDFRLSDKGKPQTLVKFSVETSGGAGIARMTAPAEPPKDGVSPPTGAEPAMVAPDHYVAYLFDDIHLDFPNLVQVRKAAESHIASHLTPADRVAVFTTSGQTTLDFTDDRDKLHEALAKLRPRPAARSTSQECPDVSFYMADQIVNKGNQQALDAAATEAMVCMNLTTIDQGRPVARQQAGIVLNSGEHETRLAMFGVRDLIRRMGTVPGQRTIVLISPGFLRLADQLQDETELMDRAIRAGVIINSLDARGLYTAMPDISKRVISASAEQVKQQLDRQSEMEEASVLAELADGTGGTFIHNTNDLTNGLSELSAAPEVFYLLGFSPQNLKLDGNYHALKVSVTPAAGLNVKARRGYYAPRHLSDADEDAKEEISQAIFSRDEMRDIPIDLHTQFFKANETEARLSVVSRVDVRKLRFRKADGRNVNDVVLVAALFDRNGNFLQATSKTLKMRLLDDTLANKVNAGISIRTDFKVTPGTYIVRLVVRDAEGQAMAAQNGAVEIP